MLSSAYETWRRVLGTRLVWTAVVWSSAWAAIYLGALVFAGAGTTVSNALYPGRGMLFGQGGLPTSEISAVGAVLAAVILVGVGPFVAAGLYGIFTTAVRNERVAWSTFWTMATRLYGRVWGIVGYGLGYGVAVIILYVVGVELLGIIGLVLVSLLVIVSLPWPVRMAGRLLVDRLTWGSSLRQSFHGDHYGAILIGLVLALVGYAVSWEVVVEASRMLGVWSDPLYLAFYLVQAVAGPVWIFALYRAEQAQNV